jgi:hypothetical protein
MTPHPRSPNSVSKSRQAVGLSVDEKSNDSPAVSYFRGTFTGTEGAGTNGVFGRGRRLMMLPGSSVKTPRHGCERDRHIFPDFELLRVRGTSRSPIQTDIGATNRCFFHNSRHIVSIVKVTDFRGSGTEIQRFYGYISNFKMCISKRLLMRCCLIRCDPLDSGM